MATVNYDPSSFVQRVLAKEVQDENDGGTSTTSPVVRKGNDRSTIVLGFCDAPVRHAKFKTRMDTAHVEAAHMRDTCRAAAAASARTRDEAAKTKLPNLQSGCSLQAAGARAIASHAMQILHSARDLPTGSGRAGRGNANSYASPHPGGGLGHLAIPKPTLEIADVDPAGVATGSTPAALLDGAGYQHEADFTSEGQERIPSLAAPCYASEGSLPDGSLPSPANSRKSAPGSARPVASMPVPGVTRKVDEDDGVDRPAQQPMSLALTVPMTSKPSKEAPVPTPLQDGEEIEMCSEDSVDLDSSSEGADWPPKRPLLPFKMLIHFSADYKSEKMIVNEDAPSRKMKEPVDSNAISDMIIAWINKVFEMSITTEHELQIGFPIVVLTMLDAIYPKRVRWREINWQFQYKRAVNRNFCVLEAIWAEVNMEKAREFRYENTPLRLDQQPYSTPQDKMEFLRLMKRWFDVRIHHGDSYDPILKRREYVKQCKAWGHPVKFPPWINYTEEEESGHRSEELESKEWYDKMPEFERLIHFLGSPEHQRM